MLNTGHRPLVVAGIITALGACAPQTVPPPIATEGEGEGEGEDACIPVSLGPVRFSFQDDVSTHYEAQLTTTIDTAVPDYLVLQFFNYNERIGDLGIGSFALNDGANGNYGACTECVLVFVDQLDANATPTRTFFQSAGTITLTQNPRETRNLAGSLRGLQLVESTIGGPSLESAPVPGGACLVVDDLELDVRYVPAGWTCEPERFNAGDGVCDCNCGDVDDDCFSDPAPTTVIGCEEGEACRFDFVFGGAATPKCVETCDVFAGAGCAGGGVCALGDPQDLCQDDVDVVDLAGVGEACGTDFNRFICGVVDTIPQGLCSNGNFETGADRVCQPLCERAADCNEGQFCYTIVGGSEDGTGRGYCENGTAP